MWLAGCKRALPPEDLPDMPEGGLTMLQCWHCGRWFDKANLFFNGWFFSCADCRRR